MGAVLKTIQTAAVNGDAASARFLLSLFIPKARSASVDIGQEIPALDSAEAVAAAHAAIIGAATRGVIGGDEAAALSGLLSEQRRQIEATALERKLNRLESGKVIDLSGLDEA